MTQIDVKPNGFVVDAAMIAQAFDLDPAQVQPLMRSGEITSLSETGTDEDAGRARLTFRYGERAVRFVIDPSGTVLKRTRFPVQTGASIAARLFGLSDDTDPKARK